MLFFKWVHFYRYTAADLVLAKTGIEVSTNALFDIQVKRIHEYKRQLLNIFYIIHRYNALRDMSAEERAKQVGGCTAVDSCVCLTCQACIAG
jgi:glucan phosphorylase